LITEKIEGYILLQRAQQLRKFKSNQKVRAQRELHQQTTLVASLIKKALLPPLIIWIDSALSLPCSILEQPVRVYI
jgi:hypothetical protein